jgi:hypothetical protein
VRGSFPGTHETEGIVPAIGISNLIHGITNVKTLLITPRAYVGYDDDGYLVHTDKKSGKQKISLKRWPDAQAAKLVVATALGKIEWEALDEPPHSSLGVDID